MSNPTESMLLNFFLIPMMATLVFLAVLYPCAVKIGFTDKPSHRKQHRQPTPLIGGLAIYLAILVTFFFNSDPLPNQTAFLYAATLLVCVGLVDDYRGLGVKIRMLAQIGAGFLMTEYADIKIDNLGNLFGFGDIHLGALATAFTIFAVVGGINAFNMIDGIDGLAGSLTLVSIASLANVSWQLHNDTLFSYCLIFTACITAFLLLNLPILGRSDAKIFLGDTGSTLFGFSVCWLAIDASQGTSALITPSTVLWIMALPLFDSVCIMLRRLSKGRSPFNPDREHLHHIFTVAGYSKNLTLALLLLISLLLSLAGITASRYLAAPEPLVFGAFMLLFAGHYWLMHNAWRIMKISRYLRVTKVFDRRIEDQRKINIPIDKEDQRTTEDPRSVSDRRYTPSEHQLEKIYRSSGGHLAPLLGQRFRSRKTKDRRTQDQEQEALSATEADREKPITERSDTDRRNAADY